MNLDVNWGFTIMWKNEELAKVSIAYGKLLKFELKPFAYEHQFYVNGEVTYVTVFDWLSERCPPIERPNIDKLLANAGLTDYNIFDIVRATHGVIFDDFEWVKFDGEDIVWEDVKIRG